MNARDHTRDEARIVDGQKPAAWLVVVTKGNQEKVARANLLNQGFEVYLPLRLLDEVTAKRRGVTAVPLFPRILFARATLDAYRWQAIFSTVGVVRVLCDPRKPKGVRPEFVERLKREEIGGFLKAGLHDPSRPATAAPPKKDHRKWVKLDDVVAGLLEEGVDEHRKSLLVSLLNEARPSLTADIRRI